MLSNTLLKALNEQIRMEFSSAYLYLSMSAYFERESLPGFAHWMRAQFDEEQAHAMRLYDFVNDRGGRVVLGSISQPPDAFQSPLAVFEDVLKHEQEVTRAIHDLYELALKEKDFPTQTHLHWFINEQVEEEKTATEILDQLKLIGDHPHLMLGLDRRLGLRGNPG